MIYILLTQGFQESETCGPLDVLRHAGAQVQLVNVTGDPYLTGSHGARFIPDIQFDEMDLTQCEALIMPGGLPGATNLAGDERVLQAVRTVVERGGLVCAICAAPIVLGKLGLLRGKKACVYPGFEEWMEGAEIVPDLIVEHDQFILANGPSAAFPFGFAIARRLLPAEAVQSVWDGMLMNDLGLDFQLYP